MSTTAQQLAALGRNGDDHLVHMSGAEVRALHGLGALTGRPMTTNPQTGLPEAFSLSSLIPLIVGIGGNVLSGGTLSPLMAGMISGAATTAATGSLSKGLMAGISGGALSGIGAGISELGAAGSAAAGQGVGLTAADAAGSGLGAAGTDTISAMAAPQAMAAQSAGMNGAQGLASSGGAFGAGPAALPAMNGAPGIAVPQAAMTAPINQGFSGSDFAQNVTNPDKLRAAFGGDNFMGRTVRGGIPLMSALGGAFQQTPDTATGGSKADPNHKELHQDQSYTPPSDPHYALNGTEPNMFGPIRYYATGGLASLDGAPSPDMPKKVQAIRSRYRSLNAAVADINTPDSLMQQLQIVDKNDPILQAAFGYTAKQGTKKQAADPNAVVDTPVQAMAQGGEVKQPEVKSSPMGSYLSNIAANGSADDSNPMGMRPEVAQMLMQQLQRQGAVPSDFGVTQASAPDTAGIAALSKQRDPNALGQGGLATFSRGGDVSDGMSDSIPATIDGEKPAAISSGEFIFPADAVSGLGNGSTQAGAEHLRNMVGRIRGARTGHTQQAPRIQPKQVMPV